MRPFNALRMRTPGSTTIANPTTLSPNYHSANVTLSNGNRTAAYNGGVGAFLSTDAKTSGKWYFEVTVDTAVTGGGAFGIGITTAAGSSDALTMPINGGIAFNAYGAVYYSDTGVCKSNTSGSGNPTTSTTVAGYTAGDVIGVEIDLDGGHARYRKNGGSWTADITISTGKPMCPAGFIDGRGTGQLTFNFGGSAWHDAPDSGYSGWTLNASYAGGRYWKMQYLSVAGTAGGAASLAEIELRLSSGGSDQTGSGTATASTTYSGLSPANAVDNNISTLWGASSGSTPEWWKYDFGSGVHKAIVEALITMRNDYYQYPTQFLLLYSDDNSLWYPGIAKDGLSWTQGEAKTFTWG